MVEIKVTYRGFDYHETGAIAQAAPLLRRVHRSLTRQIATEARHRVPVLTGHLGRSISEDPQRMDGPLIVGGGVTAWAKYARFVHNGTGVYGPSGMPFVIRPRNPAGVLHFFWNGREIFAKSVTVKGMRGRPFLTNAGTAVTARDPRIRHG